MLTTAAHLSSTGAEAEELAMAAAEHKHKSLQRMEEFRQQFDYVSNKLVDVLIDKGINLCDEEVAQQLAEDLKHLIPDPHPATKVNYDTQERALAHDGSYQYAMADTGVATAESGESFAVRPMRRGSFQQSVF